MQRINRTYRNSWRHKVIAGCLELCYILDMGNQRAKAACPPYTEGLPSGRKKGGIASDYIRGIFLVLYIHCRPCRSVLSDFQGQKIAATTAIVTA